LDEGLKQVASQAHKKDEAKTNYDQIQTALPEGPISISNGRSGRRQLTRTILIAHDYTSNKPAGAVIVMKKTPSPPFWCNAPNIQVVGVYTRAARSICQLCLQRY
jgi:hypothetical protein